MSSSSIDTLNKAVSTTVIVAAVVGTVIGLALCIGSIVILICIIKHCNKRSRTGTGGMILQPYPDNVPNYPPPYQNNVPSYPPPYTSSQSEFSKIQST